MELGSLSHAFTHLRVTYHLHLFRGAGLKVEEKGSEPVSSTPRQSDTRVVCLKDLDDLPLPVAQQKIGRRAREFLAGEAPLQ